MRSVHIAPLAIPGSSTTDERAPEQVVRERVHPQTLVMIEMLSSKQFDALQFVAHLLRLATAKQYSVFQPTGETTDRAVIAIKSVQELCSLSHWPWGYTTTHKAIRVLEALELLYRVPGELHFLCGAPRLHPRILANLKKLQMSKTPKVRQLASRVQKQLEAKLERSQERLGEFERTGNSPIAQATQRLATVLQRENIPITPQLAEALYVTCQELAGQLLSPSSTTEKALSLKDETWFSFDGIAKGIPEGNSSETKGNSPSLEESANRVPPYIRSDREFPLRREFAAQTHPSGEPQGSVRTGEFPFVAQNSPLKDQNSPYEPGEGNSEAALTLNVITLSQESNINLNVRDEENADRQLVSPSSRVPLARALAHAVEGHHNNVANYISYLSRFEYKTILATYLYVEQQRRLSRSRIKAPGKYFDTMLKVWAGLGTYDQACACYDQARAEGMVMRLPGIPWDIRRLVERFEQWPLEDIVTEIRLHPESVLLAAEEPAGNGEVAGFSEGVGCECEESSEACGVEPRAPQKWMNQEEARTLLQLVQHQAAEVATLRGGASITVAATPRPYRVRGTRDIVYLVDVTLGPMPVAFASAQQWQLYYLEQTDLQAYKALCQQLGDGYDF